VFAKDAKGDYYVMYHPTDVRLERETPEKMEEDMDEWAKLNEWARTTLIDEIINNSKDLTREHYTNTTPDMYIAKAGFDKDAKYTISTTEFGPLEPNGVDGSNFADQILRGGRGKQKTPEIDLLAFFILFLVGILHHRSLDLSQHVRRGKKKRHTQNDGGTQQ
jgi:hypothetical protein